MPRDSMARTNLTAKLEPIRTSPKFRAILGAMLGERWTSPALVELCATSDGFFLGRVEGDCGFNVVLGTLADLERNLHGIAGVAELTDAERAELLALAPNYGGSDAAA